MPSKFLPRSFFQRPHLEVARDLVGATLTWNGAGGIVVETESYAVSGDPACHTAMRPSTRAFVESRRAGDAYVYLNYGMYWLLNVLVKGGGEDGIVLIRALEPTHGVDAMRERRGRSRETDLCSGPGKLGVALGIDRTWHGRSLLGEDGPVGFRAPRAAADPVEIAVDTRIGISQAADFPWRFLAAGNPHVSVAPPALRRKRMKRRTRVFRG